ncbi:hypothetical protein EON67_12005, partial [archaeon]
MQATRRERQKHRLGYTMIDERRCWLPWWLVVVCAAGSAGVGSGINVISTVAGGGVGDGMNAKSAALWNPYGVFALYNATSGGAIFYIADKENHRIRRVGEDGIISTVAGNGADGYSGDDGPATSAMLRSPASSSAWYNASSGGTVVYLADTSNHRIRR